VAHHPDELSPPVRTFLDVARAAGPEVN
jgi:hypothetical protein